MGLFPSEDPLSQVRLICVVVVKVSSRFKLIGALGTYLRDTTAPLPAID